MRLRGSGGRAELSGCSTMVREVRAQDQLTPIYEWFTEGGSIPKTSSKHGIISPQFGDLGSAIELPLRVKGGFLCDALRMSAYPSLAVVGRGGSGVGFVPRRDIPSDATQPKIWDNCSRSRKLLTRLARNSRYH